MLNKVDIILGLLLKGKDGNIVLAKLIGLAGEGFFKNSVDYYKLRGYTSVKKDAGDKLGGV